MTIEQAIDYLNMLRDEVWNEDSDGYEYAKAIDMAIEALSAQEEPNRSDTEIPCENCQEFVCYGCDHKR